MLEAPLWLVFFIRYGDVALVPPPRFNLVRYYGVFASQHRLRAAIAPKGKEPEVRQLKLFELRPWLDGRELDGVGFVKRSGAAQARHPGTSLGRSCSRARSRWMSRSADAVAARFG